MKTEESNLLLSEFIRLNFYPVENLHEADLTITTSQFIELLKTNFEKLTIENVCKVLHELSFTQKYFDGEMVWLISHK